MSSRKYHSGAEKRKLKQQKENEAKNHPTIFKFLKPENDAKSNVTTHSSFNSDTMIENLETEIQVNNLDINSLNNYETELKLVANNSVSTNNVLMSSSNKIEISKDPGLWPETIDRFFREECIKLGSVFFQNRNKEYPASKRLFNSQNRFLGDNEVFGVPNNGNYLGILELISQFDPFLKEHILKYGNQGTGNPSYLSKTICEELIQLMGKKVLKTIIEEIHIAKYYSLIVDSTPDCSHIDQLSIVFRYVYLGEVKERFVHFIPINSHKGKSLFDVVDNFLISHNLTLKNCRGQSFDNAANMSGKYEGLQAHIKQKNPFAQFVPCAGHSLNLIGVSATESCQEAINFFSYLQKLYNFFSSSPRRWTVLTTNLSPNDNQKLLRLKSLSLTRWCCHFESVRALFINYDNILNCLENINNDTEEKFDVRREAKSIMKKFIKFETAFMCVLWQTILERFNKVSEKLQKPGLDLLSGCDLIRSLRQFIFHERNNYEKYDNLTQTVSTKIIDVGKRKQRRCENQTILCGKKKFQVDTFFVIIDKLTSELDRRLNSYNLFLSQFKFLVNFKTDNDPDIDSLNNCIQFYHNDLDDNLKTEISHFYHYIKTVSSDIDNCGAIAKLLYERQLIDIFPNVYIALRLYLTIPLTNCEAERSFSKLALIKNRLRSTQIEDRLNALTIMSIENDICKKLSFHDVLDTFASCKSRKKYFK
ncbi:hypothetical protein QTP88_017068 [Uroleucon formosanum]